MHPSRKLRGHAEPDDRRTQKLETLGLIVIVLLILALVITRSFHHISWRAR